MLTTRAVDFLPITLEAVEQTPDPYEYERMRGPFEYLLVDVPFRVFERQTKNLIDKKGETGSKPARNSDI